jgi:ATP-dependent protease HslVU (ClpYQ) peptidase subunit
MTTIVVAKKGGTVAIGADSLTTFGDTRLADHHKRVHDKILKVGDTLIALCGSSAHFVVMENVFQKAGAGLDFSGRSAIYETFRKLHPLLKEHAFLNPKEEDDDPYESSQITALVANATGIYGVYSYREVFDFDRFWAAGSGRNFALGGMYSAFERAKTAEEVVRAGLDAGCEFDKNSAGPYEIHSLRIDPARAVSRAAGAEPAAAAKRGKR